MSEAREQAAASHRSADPHADAAQSARPVRERACGQPALRTLARDRLLYAVVDAAGKPDVYQTLAGAGAAAAPLYMGVAAALYAGVAPWLVEVDTPRLDWFGDALSPDPAWGMFVIARAGFDAVRRQLRRLLTVRLPNGGVVRFRFYDPRVFGPFLKACTAEELNFVFGSVEAFATVPVSTQQVRVWDRPWRPALLPRPVIAMPRQAALRPAPAAVGDGRSA